MKKRYYTYVVEGSGYFPIDMLRYDYAAPYQSEDSYWTCKSGNGNRSVMLISEHRPTVARWESFGWTVDSIKPL